MMAYSKSLQHSLSNTSSSYCTHNLVLQVKGTAQKQAHLSSSCNIVSACDISNKIASDISNNIASDMTDSGLHCDHTCHNGEIYIAANSVISNLTWAYLTNSRASCETQTLNVHAIVSAAGKPGLHSMHLDMGAFVAKEPDTSVVGQVVRGCGLLLGNLSHVPVSSNDLLVCWHVVTHQGQNHHDHVLSYTDNVGSCMQLHTIVSCSIYA